MRETLSRRYQLRNAIGAHVRISAGKTFDFLLRGLTGCWEPSKALHQGENRLRCGDIATDILDEIATVMLTARNAPAALVLCESAQDIRAPEDHGGRRWLRHPSRPERHRKTKRPLDLSFSAKLWNENPWNGHRTRPAASTALLTCFPLPHQRRLLWPQGVLMLWKHYPNAPAIFAQTSRPRQNPVASGRSSRVAPTEGLFECCSTVGARQFRTPRRALGPICVVQTQCFDTPITVNHPEKRISTIGLWRPSGAELVCATSVVAIRIMFCAWSWREMWGQSNESDENADTDLRCRFRRDCENRDSWTMSPHVAARPYFMSVYVMKYLVCLGLDWPLWGLGLNVGVMHFDPDTDVMYQKCRYDISWRPFRRGHIERQFQSGHVVDAEEKVHNWIVLFLFVMNLCPECGRFHFESEDGGMADASTHGSCVTAAGHRGHARRIHSDGSAICDRSLRLQSGRTAFELSGDIRRADLSCANAFSMSISWQNDDRSHRKHCQWGPAVNRTEIVVEWRRVNSECDWLWKCSCFAHEMARGS